MRVPNTATIHIDVNDLLLDDFWSLIRHYFVLHSRMDSHHITMHIAWVADAVLGEVVPY